MNNQVTLKLADLNPEIIAAISARQPHLKAGSFSAALQETTGLGTGTQIGTTFGSRPNAFGERPVIVYAPNFA
jgi:hypothetical protein